MSFVDERLNGEDGLGAIYPAMANSVMMYDALGYAEDHLNRAIARKSIEKLLVVHDDEAYCQPCLSPVGTRRSPRMRCPKRATRACRGCRDPRPRMAAPAADPRRARRLDLAPPARAARRWAFQYANAHYPDVDDTAVVAVAMERAQQLKQNDAYRDSIARAREWVVGMQSSDGGWGAFEPENTQYYLNNIPLPDHGALLDPPTADVSGRCLSMLSQLGETPLNSEPARRALDYMLKEQEPDGSWYGRWG